METLSKSIGIDLNRSSPKNGQRGPSREKNTEK